MNKEAINEGKKKLITPVIIEQVLIKIEDVRTLMYWAAEMTKGMMDSGKSVQEIADHIETKYSSLKK